MEATPSQSMSGVLRVLIDGPCGGAENMAVDEAILGAVDMGESSATLRFYRWAEPTISLGYFQKVSEWQGQEEAVSRLAMVRRQSGGGAILHDDELTYSLTLPLTLGEEFVGIESMVRLVHDGFLASMERLGLGGCYRGGACKGLSRGGPFFCFAREHALDVMLGGEKILGSSQRRRRHGCLQHGSLILRRHFKQQRSGAFLETAPGDISISSLMDDVSDYLGHRLSLEVKEGRMSQREQQERRQLLAKYSQVEWNHQR
ncbi:MAG: hypothetical protein IID32_11475 [Planctomycetes bacterium]|nr:hypothetical protein [Planctomycetota bacterium]